MPDVSSAPDTVRRLSDALDRFAPIGRSLRLNPLDGREWFEVLNRKLRPQLGDENYLIAAVVGGTNIGKSVIFNHAAGFRASATSPLASGTRHPTCLAPVGFSRRYDIDAVFPGFVVTPWMGPEAALHEEGIHRLYWREAVEMPPNLLLLDTPDVDSDARINWERADHIRQCADVLVAVLTQQKYNDAAVKEFFRKAAAEDKAVILVFNQLLLPEDEQFWPLWVDTFCRETAIRPEFVYVAPTDRRAAETIKLPFYERTRPSEPSPNGADREPHNLLEDLSRLKFDEVKWRSLRGSLRQVLDPKSGLPSYLAEVHKRCQEFQTAGELLSAHRLAEVSEWPTIPAPAVISELRRWWRDQREGWARQVHGFYNTVGNGIAWPFRKVRDFVQGEPVPVLESHREREWSAMLTAVESVYDRLTLLAELGNALLQPRLQALLSGTSRTDILRRLREAHREVDFAAELRSLVDAELKNFREDNPNAYEMFRKLDVVAAAARPATSVVLFVTGFGPVGHAITPVFADAAVQGVVHFAGDVAGGTVAAAVGETVLSTGAGTSIGYFETKFRRLQTAFTGRRAAWLADILQANLLGSMPRELQDAARVVDGVEFCELESALQRLSRSRGLEPLQAAVSRESS